MRNIILIHLQAIGHHTVTITAVNEKEEVGIRVEVECTIRPATPKFPINRGMN